MLKLFLCICIICGCGYAGFSVSLYYKKREKFFNDFYDFLQHAKTQISFFQNRLAEVFKTFECDSDLAKILSIKSKQIEEETEEQIKKPLYLKDNEWQWIIGFLDSLGKCDSYTEVDNITSMQEKVSVSKDKAQMEHIKKGAASTKLGVLLGLAVAIIIV